MNVDLPHPEGPMNAVTKFLRMSIVTSFEGDVPAVRDGEVVDVEHGLAAAAVLRDGLCDLGDPGTVDLRRRHAHSPRSVPGGHARVGARLVNRW